MSQPIKTLRQVVIENCLVMIKTEPETKGHLRRLVMEAFEKGLMIAAYSFTKGSKKKLSTLLGISYGSVKTKIKQYDIIYLGTKPKDQSYLWLIKDAYTYTDSPLSQIEWAVCHYAFLYCLSISPVKYLYDIILEEIEIPMIAAAFSEGKTFNVASQIMGITPLTLKRRMKANNMKGG